MNYVFFLSHFHLFFFEHNYFCCAMQHLELLMK
jgi:hypothetical protein